MMVCVCVCPPGLHGSGSGGSLRHGERPGRGRAARGRVAGGLGAARLVNGRAAKGSSKKVMTATRSLTSFFGVSGIAPKLILRGLPAGPACRAQREHGVAHE